MRRNALLCGPLLLLLLSGHASAEQTRELAYSRPQRLVEIYLRATEEGRRITDLKPSDLTVLEDGAPVRIARLEGEELPLQVALLIDASSNMSDALPYIQAAAASFVTSMQPGDRITLVPFNSNIRSFVHPAGDTASLVEAIGDIEPQCEPMLFEAVLSAMSSLNGKKGRKAVVVCADGTDSSTTVTLNVVLKAAAIYGHPIYAIRMGGARTDPDSERVLRRLAEPNAGRMRLVEEPDQLSAAFAAVAADLRSAYLLLYSTEVPFDGRWHDVKIAAAGTGHRIRYRNGFYARTGGSSIIPVERGELSPEIPEIRPPPSRDKSALTAMEELRIPPAPVRKLEVPTAPEMIADRKIQETPLYKVETRLVEVPVLLESLGGREIPTLEQKDFRIYEDGARREIIFFSKDFDSRNMSPTRARAIQKAETGATPAIVPTVLRNTRPLARYYVLLDDLMSDAGDFLQAKQAAQEVIREYHSDLRPITLYLTSQSTAALLHARDLETTLQQIRDAPLLASRNLTANSAIMTIYQAYLIEGMDRRARLLAELCYAAENSIGWVNELGSVHGVPGRGITESVQIMARQLVAENYMGVSRAVDGLEAVVSAASSDPESYPKVIFFISSGFVMGRASGSGLGSHMDRVISMAQSNGIRVFTLDAAGLVAPTAVGVDTNPAVLTANPHLEQLFYEHASGWKQEKESPLHQLASETGGRFLHGTNDLVTAAGSAIRATGELYYLGYLSKHPPDGRFHGIRVTTSSASVQVHTRRGFFSGRQNDAETLTAFSPSGEIWASVMAGADMAGRAGDWRQVAVALEQLVRRFPNEADYWYNLGSAHLNLHNSRRAIEVLRNAFSLSPNDREIGLQLARAFLEARYTESAAQTLRLMVKKRPPDMGLLLYLGRVYEADSKRREALQIYRQALELAPTPSMELLLLLIRTSAQLGHKIEAGIYIDDYVARGGAEVSIEEWRRMVGPGSQ